MPYGLKKFKRFAVNVWNVNTDGKTDEEIANEGLYSMEEWMKEIGVVMSIAELGVTEDDIEKLVGLTIPMNGGYKPLNRDETIAIFKNSL